MLCVALERVVGLPFGSQKPLRGKIRTLHFSIISNRARSNLHSLCSCRALNLKHMNWTNYQHVYDLYINGKKIQRIWGKRKAFKIAEQQSGCLFDVNHVELFNIITGELVYERG